MKTVTIKQGAMFTATPHEVYEILMDEKKHAEVTGGEATIGRKVGDTFTTFDGWATGENVELIKDKRIVQTWRGEDWPEGHFSTITIHLLPAKGGGTKFLFSQTDVPSAVAKDVAKGWKQYYWEPIKEFLAKE